MPIPDGYYERLIKTAFLYYSENLTQQEVAHKMGISRQAVNKYLGEAWEKKIIEIKINNPAVENKRLTKKINNHAAEPRGIKPSTRINNHAAEPHGMLFLQGICIRV